MYQRPLNSASPLHPRNGAPKRTAVAQPVPGQKRQRTGEPHPYHHGVTVDDAPNKSKTFTGTIPVHPGMTSKQVDALHPTANNGSEILRDAANLGRKPEKA
jgi:hypothetical protein